MVASIKSLKAMPMIFLLDIDQEEVEKLMERAYPTAEPMPTVEYSYKCCPTRHGCSGATNCDYAYADYRR